MSTPDTRGTSNSEQFRPTDSDWALGFYNFGQSMPWYYVGQTWFSSTSPSTNQGYLNVAVGDLSNSTQFNSVYNILNPHANDSAGYMSCTSSNMNTCTDSNSCPLHRQRSQYADRRDTAERR